MVSYGCDAGETGWAHDMCIILHKNGLIHYVEGTCIECRLLAESFSTIYLLLNWLKWWLVYSNFYCCICTVNQLGIVLIFYVNLFDTCFKVEKNPALCLCKIRNYQQWWSRCSLSIFFFLMEVSEIIMQLLSFVTYLIVWNIFSATNLLETVLSLSFEN